MDRLQSIQEDDVDYSKANPTNTSPTELGSRSPAAGNLSRPPSRPTSTHFEDPQPSGRLRPLSSIAELSNKSVRTTPSDGELPVVLRHHQSIVTFLLSEKHIGSGTTPRKKGRNANRWKIINAPRLSVLIFLGQSIILAAAWAFFIVLAFMGPLALPASLASTARNNPHILTLVVTLIATAISTISSFLLSLSIRYMVNHCLAHRSISMFSLGSSIKLLNHQFVLHSRHIGWTLISLFTLFMTFVQIAAWTTLVTPVSISSTNQYNGLELDITNNTLMQSLFNNNANVAMIDTNNANSASLHLSGLLAARPVATRSSTLLQYDRWVFDTSTGGILPLLPSSNHSGVINTHQGFTANIACQFQDLNQSSIPPLTELSGSIDSAGLNLGPGVNTTRRRLYSSRWSTICGSQDVTWSDSYYSWTNDTVVGFACPMNSAAQASPSYSFLIKGNGDFSQTVKSIVCTISPQVTSLEVDYNEAVSVLSSTIVESASAKVVSDYAVAALRRRFSLGQGLDTNEFGRAVTGVALEAGNGNGGIVLRIVEAYLRGHIEFSVTLLRSFLSVPDGDKAHSTTGTYRTQTMGFEQLPGWLNIALIPITCVCLSSLIIIFIVFVQRAKENAVPPSEPTPDRSSKAFDDKSARTPGPDRTSRYSMPGTSIVSDKGDADADATTRAGWRTSAAPTANSNFFTAYSGESDSRSTHAPAATTGVVDPEMRKEIENFDVANPFHLIAVASAGGLKGVIYGGLDEKQRELSEGVKLCLSKVEKQSAMSQVGLVLAL